MLLRLLMLALLAAPSASAGNLALVLTRSGQNDGLAFLHGEIAAAYSEAGFAVSGGLDLDRASTLAEIARFESAIAEDAEGHVLVHLSGGLAQAGGLGVFTPSDVGGGSVAELLAGAIPIPLLLDLPGTRPGAGVLVLGQGEHPVPVPQSDAVLLVDGPAQAVADLVATRLLADGLPPSQIDPGDSGVRLTGLVSDSFRLGRGGAATPLSATPASTEAALRLTEAERAALQDGLALLGYDPAESGGSFGSGTREALRRWAAASGREATGYLTAATLAALSAEIDATLAEQAALAAEREGWAAASADDTIDSYRAFLMAFPASRFAGRANDRLETLEKSAEAAERVAGYRELERSLGLTLASVATLEIRLTALGFTPGPADGRVEIATRRSIAQFQAQMGLTPTGYFNPATIQRLLVTGD